MKEKKKTKTLEIKVKKKSLWQRLLDWLRRGERSGFIISGC